MEQGLSTRDRKSVVVIDSLPLRRAEIAAFLDGWAADMGAEIHATASPAERHDLGDAGIVIVNLGGQSLKGPEMRGPLAELLERASPVPVALLSDREEAEEIVAAFQLGVSGFLPASIEPEVALHALTFIVNGGSFFPPAALLETPPRPRQHGPRNDEPRSLPRAEGNDADGEEPVAGLSARQMEVYRLLCRGVRNREIAELLQMREATVKVHVRQIIRKLGVANRTQAALSRLGPLNGEDDTRPAGGA